VKNLPKKKQKTFSLPETVSNDIDTFFDDNLEFLKKLGITNKTQLIVAMLENGKPLVQKYISHVKEAT
jgi:hypothetical protein